MSLALEGGPPSFPQACSWLVVLRILARLISRPLRDVRPLWWHVPVPLRERSPLMPVLQPRQLVTEPTVWALPVSLATTPGISFDFSWSGY
jgi:hypothetical protein